ncbi:MAG TPA: class I SAM-dependent methyltransferase [Acidimicrobiales bacterium]|nr:class I SAM-dependent methyltransferase [Acidimicrobiales bacterium]
MSWSLNLVDSHGDEVVVDVGCGDGRYLKALLDAGHIGQVVGVDISAGMVAHAPIWAGRLVGDVQALPLVDGFSDLTLAMHMLFHVADKPRAVAELRRVTRPDGQLIVAGSDRDSLHELHELIDQCADDLGLRVAPHDPGLALDDAAQLVSAVFASVERVDVPGKLQVTEGSPAVDYAASLSRVTRAADDHTMLERLKDRLSVEVAARISAHGSFTLTATGGCLVCR